MTDWSEFEKLGEEQTRYLLATRRWGPTRANMAKHWLDLQESERRSAAGRAAISEATDANSLALSANRLAEEANEVARSSSAFSREAARENSRATKTSNSIAAMALIVSIAAALVAVFHK